MGVRADSVSVGLHPTTEFFQRMSKYLEIKWVTLLFQPEKWVVSLSVHQVMPNAMTADFRIESWFKFHKTPSLFHYDRLFAVISAGPSACVWFGTEGAVNALMVSPVSLGFVSSGRQAPMATPDFKRECWWKAHESEDLDAKSCLFCCPVLLKLSGTLQAWGMGHFSIRLLGKGSLCSSAN